MSEPLIPFTNYSDFRDLPAAGDLEKDEEDELFGNTLELLEQSNAPIDKRNARINEIHTLVDQLPPINRNTLQYLCKFFERVTYHSTMNMVTSTRIAALMILAIFRAKKKEMLNVSKSGNLGLIFLSMVSYPDEIFREDDFGMQTFSK